MSKAKPTLEPGFPLPSSARAKSILELRAKRLAVAKSEISEATSQDYFLACRLGRRERYGFDYAYLDAVVYANGLTPVPATPPHIAGILNRHGHLLTVLDLRPLLGIRTTAPGADARIVVVRDQAQQLGIVVDSVIGYQDFVADALSPPMPGKDGKDAALVAGIHDGTVAILSVPTLFHNPDLQVQHA